MPSATLRSDLSNLNFSIPHRPRDYLSLDFVLPAPISQLAHPLPIPETFSQPIPELFSQPISYPTSQPLPIPLHQSLHNQHNPILHPYPISNLPVHRQALRTYNARPTSSAPSRKAPHHHVNHYNYQPYAAPAPRRPKMAPLAIAVVNSSGRQAASFIRVASAVGYKVRAQLRNLEGIVAQEIASLPNVTVVVGDLYNKSTKMVNNELIKEVFEGATVAFINTTFWGDEVAIGKALADAANVNMPPIKHYIYSSMPNHSIHSPSNTEWPSLPLWGAKAEVEQYIRALDLPATFVYTGIYNNNFTSLPYPLFCMALQPDGSFTWQAPFHPDVPLPWLDAEHDVGPAVLQLIKDGPGSWTSNGGRREDRVALAYEMLSPVDACEAFSRGIGRPIRYSRGPIEISVKIPSGYQRQLVALEKLFTIGGDDPAAQPPYFGSKELEDSCPSVAISLWEGQRGMEEYAREVFPLEEANNGLTWMHEDARLGGGADPREDGVYNASQSSAGGVRNGDVWAMRDKKDGWEEETESEDEGLVMRVGRRKEEWLA